MDLRGPLAFGLVRPWFGACLNVFSKDLWNFLILPPEPPMSFWSSAVPASKDSAISSAEGILEVFFSWEATVLNNKNFIENTLVKLNGAVVFSLKKLLKEYYVE